MVCNDDAIWHPFPRNYHIYSLRDFARDRGLCRLCDLQKSFIFAEIVQPTSHLRFPMRQALGPELIPVYRQSARGWLWVHPAVWIGTLIGNPTLRASRQRGGCDAISSVGCHYFPPDLRLPSQPHSITAPWPVQSYTACWQRHMGVNNLPKVVTQLLPRVGFEPTTCWSQVQRSTHCARPLWPFDPKINVFLGLIMEHLCIRVGNPSIIGFWDIVVAS